jgi:hypothetical protein
MSLRSELQAPGHNRPPSAALCGAHPTNRTRRLWLLSSRRYQESQANSSSVKSRIGMLCFRHSKSAQNCCICIMWKNGFDCRRARCAFYASHVKAPSLPMMMVLFAERDLLLVHIRRYKGAGVRLSRCLPNSDEISMGLSSQTMIWAASTGDGAFQLDLVVSFVRCRFANKNLIDLALCLLTSGCGDIRA